jgi:hypothetical protein
MLRRCWKKRRYAISAAAALSLPICAKASILVEQIEAEGSVGGTAPNYTYMNYAPVDFGGSATQVGSGSFAGITFHAVDTANDTNTFSSHAQNVGYSFYATGTVAHSFVSDVDCLGTDDFLNSSTLGTQISTGVGPLPGSLPAGVKVVNNSWIGSYQNGGSQTYNTDLDAQRRYDYMVNNADAVSVAGAADGLTYNKSAGTGEANPLVWACYNTIAVTGQQTFSPSGNPTKQHADISILYIDASYACGIVSGDAAALLGTAQTAGETDAMHSDVVRSLLFTGTDKIAYTSPGGGSLGGMDPVYGSGQANYNTSLSVLDGGERNLLPVTGGSNISGSAVALQSGWAYGNISSGTQDAVLIQSANAITGITASLNWNVTSQTSGGNINTSNAAEIFPNLTLELRPVTYNSSLGKYVIGSAESSNLFRSSVANDNTQYISANLGLPAGTYALVITGDASKTAAIGLSYLVSASYSSQWNSGAGGSWGTASLWSAGVPNGPAAQANLLASPGITSPSTITLDGDRIIGQLTFNNSNGYTISQGTVPGGQTGTLIFNDAGDSFGSANPLITVFSGNQTINAPVYLPKGVTANISTGTSLTMSGSINALADLIKIGSGTLTLGGADSLNVDTNAGTVILSPTATFAAGSMTVNNGGLLDLAAPGSGGILTRSFPGSPFTFTINAGGTTVLNAAASSANRQLFVTNGGLTIVGSSNSWTGKLDLNNNDADLPGASLFNTSNQILQGYNHGKWNGTGGIVSTSAANDTRHLMALGVIQNNQSGTALFTAANPFDGTTPGAGDVLIKYTYYGDANLNGKVDSTDYTLIDNGYLMHLTGWYNGDFNYDGVVNGSDYTLIDNAFNTQGAQILADIASPSAGVSPQRASSVPEPGGLGILGIAAVSVLGRRRRYNAR